MFIFYFVYTNIKFYWFVMKIKKFMLPIWWYNRDLFPLGNKYLGSSFWMGWGVHWLLIYTCMLLVEKWFNGVWFKLMLIWVGIWEGNKCCLISSLLATSWLWVVESLQCLKGKFSSGIEGALASTLNHDLNWKQLSEMILCIFLSMFSKFIWVTLIQKQQKYL